MRLLTLNVVFGFAMLLIAECVQPPEIRQSRVEVVATDPAGSPVSDVEVEVFPPTSRIPVKAAYPGLRLTYGDYRLRIYGEGFRSVWREVRIYQPDTVLRVELPVASVGCAPLPAEIGGRVERQQRSDEIWVKAIPVRGTGGGETRVTPSGFFLISGLDHSAHVLIVMKGETVLHEQVVRAHPVGSGSADLRIDLRRER